MAKNKIYKTGKRMLSLDNWRKRLIFWCGAVIVGVIAAGYAYIADYAQELFSVFVRMSVYAPFIISPVIFSIAAWLTAKYCPGAVGSGIPQAIAARVAQNPEERRYLLGTRILIGKILLTTLGLLGGASIGREGPTVQVGAAILYMGAAFGKVNAETTRNLILAGAAAGVAAAFNTPLAGIVFAIEEMARAFEHRYSGVVLTAIVLAGASSLSILGNYSYFGFADGGYSLSRDWLVVAITGVAGGLLGGLFSKILIDGAPRLYAMFENRKIYHPALFAAACGLIIALLGYATHSATFGSGYEQANAMLHGETAGSWTYTIAKLLATAVSGFSGLPGGIFSPSLSVGAGLGASMAPWFPATPLAGVVLLGMTAYFSGVTQAPITAFIIVLEISGRQSLPVPLIAASVIAVAVSRIICPVSLYHALANNFIAAIKKIETTEGTAEQKEVVA